MAEQHIQRRLAAILAADVVGYSRMSEVDEADTLAALKARRRDVLNPLVTRHHGRIFKVTGDGVLVEFGSAVNAVQCAIDLQQDMAAANKDQSPDRQIVLRVGVNLGDVMVEGGDLYGEGVNIAARLEAIAEPGRVLISGTAYDQVKNKVKAGFDNLGAKNLKNIAEPLRVYSVADTPRASLAAPNLSGDKPSIAVLPFENMSGDPEQAYFSDGITEDIITGLARFRSLFVSARNSSFAFRDKPIDFAEIGRKLAVSYILEGSIRRDAGRVRITAQLIEAATSAHVWAERYDRSLDDIFAVQDEVAQVIVAALFGRIQEAGVERSSRMPTANLTAYDCLLRGLAHFRAYTEGENQRAREMFERSVALDPRYALAHSYQALVLLAIHGWASAPADALQAAFAKARHAVELDPQESRCHGILSEICLYRREYDMAEQHIRQAFDLNPGDANIVIHKGRLLIMRGKAEEALTWLDAAVRLNPMHPPWYTACYAMAYYSLGRFAEAAQAFRRLPHTGAWSRARLAACYAQLEMSAEAQASVAEVLRLQPDFSAADYMRTDVLLERAEDRELLREGLRKAGFPE
jgi:TolB-like protein/Flp pilus assembly protein TadD